MTDTIVGNIDFAQVALYLFWIFFAGLVIYLQRENQREGYPLVNDDEQESAAVALLPPLPEKTFKLPHGRGESIPERQPERDDMDKVLARTGHAEGMPFEPTGDPMADGVGPASWAPRRDVPELDGKGHPKIIPMRLAEAFSISFGRDPRGLPVQAADGAVVGTVTDMWIDEPEQLVRYLEAELETGGKVLVPMPLARIRSNRVSIHSLYGAQFAGIPRTAADAQVTMLEEEKICAYYCGGKLYADPARQAPQL
ncbi:photosynthetic reaction center subunit H [Pontivivens insulae]|uniref:Reaction center protein H chain n=1 Tax=Pontivivens insulae TaxID=1639689 RepID=A0A2R8AAA2_9RHOB|nr:photosynthetic reaction center subunit H [Pontivivens insulae]RED12932.1 photosynthetic reaction center H subunit [Pontivivens insulae]SPF29025.1 Reaction center protein H chain [Pontivivens insulae]